MRGKVYNSSRVEQRNRITPAYAGKSKYSRAPVTHTQDHPRLCGEKVLCGKNGGVHGGSPPPMRGKVYITPLFAIPPGITPAYAGKSPSCSGVKKSLQDHPRLCGEKFRSFSFLFVCAGSPPPMRGKGHNRKAEKGGLRITPAYAGKRKKFIQKTARS